jgi:hypothetical protein
MAVKKVRVHGNVRWRYPRECACWSKRLMKRAPSARTDQRERAFYVDASPQRDNWSRPVSMPQDEAANVVDEARRD